MGYAEREHWCQRDDKKIYGKLFLPDGWDDGRPRATAIFAHGLSTNHGDMEPYARTSFASPHPSFIHVHVHE